MVKPSGEHVALRWTQLQLVKIPLWRGKGPGVRRGRHKESKDAVRQDPRDLRHAEDCNGQMHFKRCDSRASCKFAGRKLKFPFWKKAIFKDDY